MTPPLILRRAHPLKLRILSYGLRLHEFAAAADVTDSELSRYFKNILANKDKCARIEAAAKKHLPRSSAA
jgi:hypothetical protein